MPNDRTATPTELHWLTIADAARLIERRRRSPVELTDATERTRPNLVFDQHRRGAAAGISMN